MKRARSPSTGGSSSSRRLDSGSNTSPPAPRAPKRIKILQSPNIPKRKATDSLGIRQRALNLRVQQAFRSNVQLEDIKETAETSEVDKLFKIDLAAKYKHERFILEVLKSADSLYTIRALKKCLWLFDDDHTHIINPEFLHNEIFPFTSLKMKRKILSHVALHLKDETQAASFYEYCVRSKLIESALKFVVLASEPFKLALVTGHLGPIDLIVQKDTNYLLQFLKKSFTLLTALLERIKNDKKRHKLLKNFQHWYKYDSNKYLDLVEKYGRPRFNTTFSSIIVKKHKDRILSKPKFYINLIDRDILVKQSSVEDLKNYTIDLLPEGDFWNHNKDSTFRDFLDQIPHKETYDFLKKICKERYPNSEFETSKKFYEQKFYRFMTKEQQEAWAWNHIKSEKQILGVGRDYLWYGFVNFKDAFEAMKNFILTTKEVEKRNEMLRTLIRSAKTNSELKTLFSYYQKKHLNESRLFKGRFLITVVCKHNVYEFDENCWNSFHTLLLSMDIYNTKDYDDNLNNELKTVVFIFNIVNKQELTELLIQYAFKDFLVFDINKHMDNLSDSKRNILYEYLHSMYMNKILEYKYASFAKKDKTQIQKYFENLVHLMQIYHNEETPAEKYVYRRQPKQRYRNRSLSDRELIRRLKEDSQSVIEALPEVAKQFETRPFKIDTFLKKIKLYFPDEVSKSYFEMFQNNISKDLNQTSIKAAVNGVFQLGDEDYKINFMITNAPEHNKVDFSDVDPHKLRIQKAICQYFCYSRPPVPLSNTLMYLKGDYVKHCLHVFSVFLANLSFPLCLKFVEAMLDTPVSVQKHGIRLAFECFDIMNLKNLITRIWKKHKNISLRAVIYKALLKKVQVEKDVELFEVLKKFTLELGPDDEDEIFNLLISDSLADEFLGDYIEAAWNAVCKFKDKEPNIQRKKAVLERILNKLSLMREEFIRDVVLQILEELFKEHKIKTLYTSNEVLQKLFKVKWTLVKAFIIHTTSNFRTPIADVHLTKLITQVCIESWNELHSDVPIYQNLCFDFIKGLRKESLMQKNCNPIDSIPFFDTILNELQLKLPLHEVYEAFWDLNLTIIYKKVTQEKPINSDTCVEYGRGVGMFVVEIVKEGKYFTHMVSEIVNEIESHVDDLRIQLQEFDDSDVNINKASCLVKFVSGLIDQESVETYILAAKLLPSTYGCYEWDSFKEIVSKISQMRDPTVQCAMRLKLRKRYVVY